MKAESYILRFGDAAQLFELCCAKMRDNDIFNKDVANAFVIKAQFAQQMMSSHPTAVAELKFINKQPYISGEASGLMFTI